VREVDNALIIRAAARFVCVAGHAEWIEEGPMQAPFPGMDPYLEHPALWPSVHTRLMVWLAHQLRPQVRPRYVVSIEDRVFIDRPEQQQVPDVWIQKTRDQGGVATAVQPVAGTPVVVEVAELPAQELEIREHYLEILDRYQNMRVVTIVELLSPANKAPGAGRLSYLAKQRLILDSESHLIEVDLLRHGRHTLSVPQGATQGIGPFDYLVCTNRFPGRQRFELYPCPLRVPLPSIRVPLTEPDADVSIDLQAAFAQVYEDGDYMLRVRYSEPCEPALASDDQQWANECWTSYRAAHPELFPLQGS
jgi:Protein of unknown function (DUF4058)